MFRLQFDTDNAAFQDDVVGPASETARILRDVASRLEDGDLQGRCRDVNGNSIGYFKLTGDEEVT